MWLLLGACATVITVTSQACFSQLGVITLTSAVLFRATREAMEGQAPIEHL